MIHDRIMHIPAVYGAKSMLATGADTANLIDGIEADVFFTTAAFPPISRFHKIFLDLNYFFIVHQ